ATVVKVRFSPFVLCPSGSQRKRKRGLGRVFFFVRVFMSCVAIRLKALRSIDSTTCRTGLVWRTTE
ncbi:hypothetical protein ABTK60_19280, partial [Acinetobacter baumannii]